MVPSTVPVGDATARTGLRYGAPMNVAPVPIRMANVKPAHVAATEPMPAANVTNRAQVPTDAIPTFVSVAHTEPTPATNAAAPTANVVPVPAANIPSAHTAYTEPIFTMNAAPVPVRASIPAVNVTPILTPMNIPPAHMHTGPRPAANVAPIPIPVHVPPINTYTEPIPAANVTPIPTPVNVPPVHTYTEHIPTANVVPVPIVANVQPVHIDYVEHIPTVNVIPTPVHLNVQPAHASYADPITAADLPPISVPASVQPAHATYMESAPDTRAHTAPPNVVLVPVPAVEAKQIPGSGPVSLAEVVSVGPTAETPVVEAVVRNNSNNVSLRTRVWRVF
jgi:hypothetical protein